MPVPTTKLCVPITATTCGAMANDAVAAIAAGADMIELRLDYLDLNQGLPNWFIALNQIRQFNERTIITCRITQEGGNYGGDENKRAELLAFNWQALGFNCYVDIEFARWSKFPRLEQAGVISVPPTERGHPRVILSRHNFEHTPDNLSRMLDEMGFKEPDVIKIACQSNSINDSIRMLDALHEWALRRPTIALSMGETGILTRVLAKKFGAFLTFASLEQGKESAPGQITIDEMKNLYRWDAIGPQTKVYGVIGCPVAHSMSPATMNAGFTEVGHDGVYLPLRVEPDYESFAAFLDACLERPWLDLRGCSVTIPHKENLLRYVKEHGGYIEPLAQRIGVANTLMIGDSALSTHHSALSAYNTDYIGALDALCTGMNCHREELKNQRVAVLGAGGAARAIVAGLTDSGCEVTIFNRTLSKAESLAQEFNAKAADWAQRTNAKADVIINCTSIGMWPKTDESPIDAIDIPENTVVFDTVYNPIETRLLHEARECNCKTIDGVSMFINQAAAQFIRWTGHPAPVEAMRQVVVKKLSG